VSVQALGWVGALQASSQRTRATSQDPYRYSTGGTMDVQRADKE
jgi:hypothetical protein